MALMTISEFAQRTRLSAKALRLYDRLGLVVPVEVTPRNGYRYYAEEQVPDAVLVALLRRLAMPLDVIAPILRAGPTSRATLVRSYWDDAERMAAERRSLVAYLCSRMEGITMTHHDVKIRSLPKRRIASINRHVGLDGVDRFFGEAFATLRSTGPGLDGIAGCPFTVYYGEVSADSDGPVELCRPLAGLDGTADPTGGVDTRVEAAHEEIYVRLRKRELAWPAMRAALDALEAWAATHDRQPAAAFRQVLIADQRIATADDPVCDLSVPLR